MVEAVAAVLAGAAAAQPAHSQLLTCATKSKLVTQSASNNASQQYAQEKTEDCASHLYLTPNLAIMPLH